MLDIWVIVHMVFLLYFRGGALFGSRAVLCLAGPRCRGATARNFLGYAFFYSGKDRGLISTYGFWDCLINRSRFRVIQRVRPSRSVVDMNQEKIVSLHQREGQLFHRI